MILLIFKEATKSLTSEEAQPKALQYDQKSPIVQLLISNNFLELKLWTQNYQTIK